MEEQVLRLIENRGKKMDIFEELGIKRCINAHDTYTVYGGSRMSSITLRTMEEIAGAFVDMDELQRSLGDRTAKLTRNEGAYFTNGAAGSVLLAACVCMTKGTTTENCRIRGIYPMNLL